MQYGILKQAYPNQGFYGASGYYGISSNVTTPAAVVNATIVREEDYTILKWDAVTTDVFNNPANIVRYDIYRGVNSRVYTYISSVSSLDYYGNINTFFIDETLDPTVKLYFYKIAAVNSQGIAGDFSTEFDDYYLNTQYQNTHLYSYNKTSYFWSQVKNLPGQYIYNKSANVVPYIPKKPFIYTDFVNTSLYQTFIVKVGGVEYTRVRAENDYIHFMLDISSLISATNKNVTIQIVAESDPTVIISEYSFAFVNLYLFLSLMSEEFREQYINSIRTSRNLYTDEVENAYIYSNFMQLLGIEKQDQWDFDDYYKIGLSGDTTNYNGIFRDYLSYAGTYGGLKKNVYAVTNNDPIITSFRDKQGWITQTVAHGATDATAYNITSYDASGNPNYSLITGPQHATDVTAYIHEYLDAPAAMTSPNPIIMYSAVSKAFTIEIEVTNSIATYNKIIVKSAGIYDQIPGKNIVSIVSVKDANGIVYQEGVDFTVDLATGVMTWIGNKPSANIDFQVIFSVNNQALIQYIVDINKPAFIFARIKYLS